MVRPTTSVLVLLVVAAGVVAWFATRGEDWQTKLHRDRFAGTAVSDRHTVPDPSAMTLKFRYGELTITGGCNRASGTYEVTDGRLRFASPPATTQMGCEGEQADAWLAALLDGPGAELALGSDETTLKLTRGDRWATFGLMGIAGGPAPLEGPQWRANFVYDERGSMVAIEGPMVRPALRIQNGRATIFTGCNSGTASVKRLGRMVDFGDFIPTTHRSCAGYVARIDRMVRETLTGAAAFSFGNVRNVAFAKRRGVGVNFARE